MDISQMLWPTVDRKEIAHVLDDVGDQVRIETMNELGKKELATLFDAAADNEPLSLDHFVPSGVPPMTEVIHQGKNSLFAFSRFQKRFCRPAGDGGRGPRAHHDPARAADPGLLPQARGPAAGHAHPHPPLQAPIWSDARSILDAARTFKTSPGVEE